MPDETPGTPSTSDGANRSAIWALEIPVSSLMSGKDGKKKLLCT